MAVPKMVINGVYSLFDNWVCFQFPFINRTPMVDPNIRSTIITIFNQLRNKHARGGDDNVSTVYLKRDQEGLQASMCTKNEILELEFTF
jgi:hypothetical protein